jgi:hypothetical protein
MLLMSGCLSGPSPGAPPLPGMGASFPFLFDCSGLNAFVEVDAAALAPLVPRNWTFTTPVPAVATVRVLLGRCAEGDLLLLATPMFTDEASKGFSENPDVLLGVYASNLSVAAAWFLAGAPAQVATFSPGGSLPGDEGVVIATSRGTAVTITLAPLQAVGGSHYDFREVYAAPGDPIRWIWGDENATMAQTYTYTVEFGPASVFDGVETVEYVPAYRWTAFDMTYAPGLPPLSSG